MFFTKYTLFAEKNVFIWKKSFIMKMFLLKKTSFTERNINENVKKIYLVSEIYFYTKNVCVTNKIQIFLKCILILQKEKNFDHKKYNC